MQAHFKTPFHGLYDGIELDEMLGLTVRCARGTAYYQRTLPDIEVSSVEDFSRLPFSSRVDLSMVDGLDELIGDPSKIFRSVYPFSQNTCTFPFQVVHGEEDLYRRHERMQKFLELTGYPKSGETLILTSPAQFFFASDFCGEILYEGYHSSIQNIGHLSPEQIRARIDDFGAEIVVLATDDPRLRPELIPERVRALITFRGAYPEMAELDATVIDLYTLTEVPYIGHRLAGDPCYHYDETSFYIERSPRGRLTITTLLWEVMPFIRYETYDLCGRINDAEGYFEVRSYGEW